MRTSQKNEQRRSSMPAAHPQGIVLQRKCACGGSAGVDTECKECSAKRLSLQRYSSSRVAPHGLVAPLAVDSESTPPKPRDDSPVSLGHNFGQVELHSRTAQKVQTKSNAVQASDQYEEEADRISENVTGVLRAPSVSFTSPVRASQVSASIQRAPNDQQKAMPEAAPTSANSKTGPAEAASAPPESAGISLIVEDDAREIGPGQMHKSDFLDKLQTAICALADAELAAVGRNTEGCPYIEKWLRYYRTRSAQHVERTMHRYAPESQGVASARDYLPLLSERVRRAVAVWAKTGEITGVPEGASAGPPETGPTPGRESSAAAGKVQSKEADGGARSADNPAAVRAQLDVGRTLDPGVKPQMESAFGHDFSRVRVHTDSKAAELSSGLNARAFTIGSDIAFASGEYQPGTLVGDALIAHELAHVVQQGSGSSSVSQPQTGNDSGSLERDADDAALAAVASRWAESGGPTFKIAKSAKSNARSGLRLQRCSPSVITTTSDPSDFQFKVVVPLSGPGPGGWKVACYSPEFASYTNDERKKWTLECDFEVGVPIENSDGPVSDALAQERAQLAASAASQIILRTFGPLPTAPPKALYCSTFQKAMHEAFSRPAMGGIKGGKVTKFTKNCL